MPRPFESIYRYSCRAGQRRRSPPLLVRNQQCWRMIRCPDNIGCQWIYVALVVLAFVIRNSHLSLANPQLGGMAVSSTSYCSRLMLLPFGLKNKNAEGNFQVWPLVKYIQYTSSSSLRSQPRLPQSQNPPHYVLSTCLSLARGGSDRGYDYDSAANNQYRRNDDYGRSGYSGNERYSGSRPGGDDWDDDYGDQSYGIQRPPTPSWSSSSPNEGRDPYDEGGDYFYEDDPSYDQPYRTGPPRRTSNRDNFAVSATAFLSRMPAVIRDGDRRIGLPLLASGMVITMLGVSLFFNRTLMRLGNLLFLVGVPMTIGPQRTLGYFLQPQKTRATACLAVGIFLVLIGHPLIGILFEIFGLLNLFGNMFPVLLAIAKQMPFIGPILSGTNRSGGNNQDRSPRSRGRYREFNNYNNNEPGDNDDYYGYDEGDNRQGKQDDPSYYEDDARYIDGRNGKQGYEYY